MGNLEVWASLLPYSQSAIGGFQESREPTGFTPYPCLTSCAPALLSLAALALAHHSSARALRFLVCPPWPHLPVCPAAPSSCLSHFHRCQTTGPATSPFSRLCHQRHLPTAPIPVPLLTSSHPGSEQTQPGRRQWELIGDQGPPGWRNPWQHRGQLKEDISPVGSRPPAWNPRMP